MKDAKDFYANNSKIKAPLEEEEKKAESNDKD
jgi:hypothetical protein